MTESKVSDCPRVDIRKFNKIIELDSRFFGLFKIRTSHKEGQLSDFEKLDNFWE